VRVAEGIPYGGQAIDDRDKRPFRPVTVAEAYGLLHAVFETPAEEDRIIARNPCNVKGAGQEESDEREIVPLPVVFKLAETVPVRYRALILLATFGDLRWGELAGLRRENRRRTQPL